MVPRRAPPKMKPPPRPKRRFELFKERAMGVVDLGSGWSAKTSPMTFPVLQDRSLGVKLLFPGIIRYHDLRMPKNNSPRDDKTATSEKVAQSRAELALEYH